MSNLDEISSKEVFDVALANQREALFDALGNAANGSDELSAFIKAAVMRTLLERIDPMMIGPLFENWLVLKGWSPNGIRTSHTMLFPYSTSMDGKLPGENIVMLAKQHRPPGVPGERWAALQDGAKISYLANDPILACRLNALRAILPA